MTVSRDVGYIRVGNMCDVHFTPRDLVLSRLTFRATVAMEEEQFQRLLDAISACKKDLQAEFTDKLVKLQKKVTARQESSSQGVVEKIQNRSYQFRRKGNEEQFKFNASVDKHLGAAKELSKLEPQTEEENNTIAHSKAHLDEGMKKIAVRQKHIKIADRSDLGWAVVEAYMDDELVLDSDDERRLYKANREAQQTVKRKKANSAATASKRRAATASVEPPERLGNQGTRAPAVARPRMVGPCYRCGELGHLVASCPKPRQQYPFEQSVVKGTDLCMNFVDKEGVDNAIAIEHSLVSETWQLLPGEDDIQLCGTMATEYSDCQPGVDCSLEMDLCLDREGMNEETPEGPLTHAKFRMSKGESRPILFFGGRC